MLEKYNEQTKQFKKILIGLAVAAKMSYEDILLMTAEERNLLADVLREKAEAQNPNKKSQAMVPGKVNAPTGPSQTRQEPR